MNNVSDQVFTRWRQVQMRRIQTLAGALAYRTREHNFLLRKGYIQSIYNSYDKLWMDSFSRVMGWMIAFSIHRSL